MRDGHGDLFDERPDGEETQEVLTGFGRMRGLGRRMPSSVWFATGALFLLSWLIEPGSVSSVAIKSMLPFAGILAVVAVGQTLVVQQRGIDLSVPGGMTLAAIIVSKFAHDHGGRIWLAILVTILVAIGIGILNGIVVSWFRVTPLVATLAMNAILVGALRQYSGGTPPNAPDGLSTFALDHTLEIPNTVIIALCFVVVVAVFSSYTSVGRRFALSGSNERAARASGIPVLAYRFGAYVAASVCYASAGIVMAGYVSSPSVTAGDAYLLPSIAAVVVGGTAFSGGRGNILGTAVGAVFLSQLTQLVLSMGTETSVQLLIQSLVIAVAAAVQTLRNGTLSRIFGRLRLATSRRAAS